MKHILTAALAALALGAAQAVTVGWTPASYDWTVDSFTNGSGNPSQTLTLTDGCGTVAALITTSDAFATNRANIFAIENDGFGTTAFRMANGTYLLTATYSYADGVMTLTCRVNDVVVFTGTAEMAAAPTALTISNIGSFGSQNFFTMEELSGYDAAWREFQETRGGHQRALPRPRPVWAGGFFGGGAKKGLRVGAGFAILCGVFPMWRVSSVGRAAES